MVELDVNMCCRIAPSSMQARDRLGPIPLKLVADAIASVGSYDIGTGEPNCASSGSTWNCNCIATFLLSCLPD